MEEFTEILEYRELLIYKHLRPQLAVSHFVDRNFIAA